MQFGILRSYLYVTDSDMTYIWILTGLSVLCLLRLRELYHTKTMINKPHSPELLYLLRVLFLKKN